MIHEVCSCGFPHSDTRGSADMCSSPRLFAAYHVLLRLPVPRHSPCALLQLTSSVLLSQYRRQSHVLAYTWSAACPLHRALQCADFFLAFTRLLNFMIDPHFPFRFRLNHILDSFPICCLRILHRDCLPVYVMSSCPLRVQEAHASRGMWLRLFRPVRKRPAVSAVSTHHFEDTCVCSFQGTSMPVKNSGGHLLSRTVSSAVPSAGRVLTVVFGMGTGVAPDRIAA